MSQPRTITMHRWIFCMITICLVISTIGHLVRVVSDFAH